MKVRPIAAALALVAAGSSPVLLSVACSDLTTPQVPTQLAFTTQPATVGAGVPMAPPIVVTFLDAGGNPVPSANKIITLELASNAASATLLGVTNIVAVNGVATFSNVSTTKFGAGYRLIATAVGVLSATSSAFDVTFGPASQLAFTVQPATTAPASSITPAVLVEVRDAFGNTVTTATNAITLAISANAGGGTLSGTTTVAAVNGVATFSNLSINNAGESYSLAATASNLSGATSSSFEIRAPITFATVTSGYFHACGLAVGGKAYCWGENSDGQLGALHGILPGPVSGGHTFGSLSAGRTHTCGITTAGASYCWGSGDHGELGFGGTARTSAPTQVTGSFAALSAGYSHSCAVTASGAGYCWGDNAFGELGNGTITQSNIPAAVSGGLTFSSISPGRFFTCGLTTAGTAHCWGDNFFGELGDGTKVQRTSPVPVSTSLKFTAVSAGGFHACGLIAGGAAYCWGDNTYGQLGDGTQNAITLPVQVAGGRTFATISAGNRHTCAVTTGGAAFCWGDNTPLQLGTGGSSSSSIPVDVVGNLTFSSVSAGRFHTCGVTTASAGYCWGNNAAGKLGDGSTASSPVPIPIR
jgi:alpha-tubulin suppressor-like RCC1 family protein